MKRITQIFLLAVAFFAATSIKGAQPSTDHTPRDHDRLHPGLAASHSLILSINDSTRTVLIDPQAVSFDDSYDASPYIDGDTIYYVQFATKHRFMLRGDTLSYIGYENRTTDFRLDAPVSMAVFSLKDGALVRAGWSGHMLHYGSMILRHVRGTSVSSVEEGWTLTDGTDTVSDATRLLWKLDMAYADSDSIDAEMPDSVASERISEMQVDVKAMLSERLLTERAMWFSEGARYPVLTDSRVSRGMLKEGGILTDTVQISMLAMHYPASYQHSDTGEDFMTRKPTVKGRYYTYGEYVHKDNDPGTSINVGEPELSDNALSITLSSRYGTCNATVTPFTDSGMMLNEPMEVTLTQIPQSCTVSLPIGWKGVVLLRVETGDESCTRKIII